MELMAQMLNKLTKKAIVDEKRMRELDEEISSLKKQMAPAAQSTLTVETGETVGVRRTSPRLKDKKEKK